VIRTCSVVFRESTYDERPYARAVAELHGCEHVEVELDGGDVQRELPRAIWAMDQPTVDGINSYFVSLAARQSGLTVALSGLGGDELFGGYSSFALVPKVYRAARLASLVPFGPALVSATLGRQRLGSNQRRLGGAFTARPSLTQSYAAVRGVFGVAGAAALLRPELLVSVGATEWHSDPNGYAGLDPLDAISRLELRRYMHDQLLRDTDAMSMAHSLEVRVPLLDERLVEYVLAQPPGVRAAGGVPKGLLRAAVADLLPPVVRNRAKKQGFTFPFQTWLGTSLAPILADALDGAMSRPIFRPAAVARLRADYAAGLVHWSRVWAVAVLELWLREASAAATSAPLVGARPVVAR
jgi:asparagine synthase (glutamine-hydrolysing)